VKMRAALLLVLLAAILAATAALPLGDEHGDVAMLEVEKKGDSKTAREQAKLDAEEAKAEAAAKKNVKAIDEMEKQQQEQSKMKQQLKDVRKAAKAASKLTGDDSMSAMLGDSAPSKEMRRLGDLVDAMPTEGGHEVIQHSIELDLGDGLEEESSSTKSSSAEDKKLDKELAKTEAASKKNVEAIDKMEANKKKEASLKKKMKSVAKMAKSAGKLAGKDSLGEEKGDSEAKLAAEAAKVKANAKNTEDKMKQMDKDMKKQHDQKEALKKKMKDFKHSVSKTNSMAGDEVAHALGEEGYGNDTPVVVERRLQRLATEDEELEVSKTSKSVNDFATSAEQQLKQIHK